MAKWQSIPRKRRTRAHVLADLGLNHVERHVLLCGYTVERRVHDYGIDLMMKTYNRNGEVENGDVLFQLKATERVKWTADGQTILFRIDRADLRSWLGEPMPVLLVIYDASVDAAFWLYVQAEFEKWLGFNRKHGSRTVTVRIPKTQQIDRTAVREFARYKDRILAQQKRLVHHE